MFVCTQSHTGLGNALCYCYFWISQLRHCATKEWLHCKYLYLAPDHSWNYTAWNVPEAPFAFLLDLTTTSSCWSSCDWLIQKVFLSSFVIYSWSTPILYFNLDPVTFYCSLIHADSVYLSFSPSFILVLKFPISFMLLTSLHGCLSFSKLSCLGWRMSATHLFWWRLLLIFFALFFPSSFQSPKDMELCPRLLKQNMTY